MAEKPKAVICANWRGLQSARDDGASANGEESPSLCPFALSASGSKTVVRMAMPAFHHAMTAIGTSGHSAAQFVLPNLRSHRRIRILCQLEWRQPLLAPMHIRELDQIFRIDDLDAVQILGFGVRVFSAHRSDADLLRFQVPQNLVRCR